MISDQAASRVRREIGWSGRFVGSRAVVMGRKASTRKSVCPDTEFGARGVAYRALSGGFLDSLGALTTPNS